MRKLDSILGIEITMALLLLFLIISSGFFWGNFIWEKCLEPTWISELPGGGYIYIENGDYMWIRYNSNSWNGTLDYQITLNPKVVR